MKAAEHRARARTALRGSWSTAILTLWLAGVLSGEGGPTLVPSISPQLHLDFNVPTLMRKFLTGVLGIPKDWVTPLAAVVLVATTLLGGVISLGRARYALNLIDGREADLTDLFSGFSRFFQAMVMHLLSQLLIQLGLLLVVPGILASYILSQAPYIMAEDPDCTGWEALKRSAAMMRGNLLKLIKLDLSFLVWNLLSSFTQGIGPLFLNPYQTTARASFFREISS